MYDLGANWQKISEEQKYIYDFNFFFEFLYKK